MLSSVERHHTPDKQGRDIHAHLCMWSIPALVFAAGVLTSTDKGQAEGLVRPSGCTQVQELATRGYCADGVTPQDIFDWV